jgi:hypothetical protein
MKHKRNVTSEKNLMSTNIRGILAKLSANAAVDWTLILASLVLLAVAIPVIMQAM